MTTDRFRQRQRARRAAIFVVTGAVFTVLPLTNAAATENSSDPEVQIGESRSIERSASSIATATDEPGLTDDASVAGVAVAGVAIARAAPLPHRLDTDIGNGGTNPLPLFIALSAEAAMIATLWHRSRRTIL